MQNNNAFFVNETNIYAFTVPGMYEKKNLVEEIKYCSDYLRLLSDCYCPFIYVHNVKTASIYLYHFLVAKSDPYFTFPNLRHQKLGYPIFHSEQFNSCLVPAMDCLKQM